MDNSFEIAVSLNSRDYLFPATLISFGYSYKIEVNIDGTIVNFERDEEGNFRAFINPEDMTSEAPVSKELLQVIAAELDELFTDK
jgi:hypothetical protein